MGTLYTHAESNIRRTWLYLALFFALLVFLGWVFSQFFGDWTIFWIFLALSLLINLSSFWYSDKIVLKLSRAQPIEKKDSPELYRLVENLAITAGLPCPKIYLIKSPQPNAFATGRDEKQAVVALTSGLLEKLDRAELEGVIAHELSHIGNKDMLLATIIVVLVGMIALASRFLLRAGLWGEGRRSRERGGSLLLPLAILAAFLAPFAATLLRLAISRKREFLADATGALLTRYPEGLARALEKIAASPRSLKVANNATAHLYIANPFKGKESKTWLVKLFSTHPPIEERIKALRGMEV